MALPAFQLREQGLAVGDALDGDWRFGGNLDGLASFFLLPPRGEGLDIRDQIGTLLIGPDGQTKATAGSTGTGSATISSNKKWDAILIALKSAP